MIFLKKKHYKSKTYDTMTTDFSEVYKIINSYMNDKPISLGTAFVFIDIQKLIEKIENKKLQKIPTIKNFDDFIIWTKNLDLDKHKKWYIEFLDTSTTENMLLKQMNEINEFNYTDFSINVLKQYLINSFESLWFFSSDVFSSIFSDGDTLTDSNVREDIYDICGYIPWSKLGVTYKSDEKYVEAVLCCAIVKKTNKKCNNKALKNSDKCGVHNK